MRIPTTFLPRDGPKILVDYSLQNSPKLFRTWSNKWPLSNTKFSCFLLLLPSRSVDHWFYHRAATLWILGRCSTRIQSALHWYHHNLCSFSRLGLLQPCSSKLRWIRDVEEPFRSTTQNRRIHRFLCFEDWWLFHHQSVTDVSKNSFPNEFCPNHGFPPGHWSTARWHRTSASTWDLQNCWWIFWIVEKVFPMNIAAFIVAIMNIPHIIECSSPDSATFEILFGLLRTCWSFTLFTNSAASLPMTKVSESASSW